MSKTSLIPDLSVIFTIKLYYLFPLAEPTWSGSEILMDSQLNISKIPNTFAIRASLVGRIEK